MPTPVFDGHNDALLRAGPTELLAGRPDGHLDIPRARQGGLAGGIFAVFTPEPGAARDDLTDGGWERPLPAAAARRRRGRPRARARRAAVRARAPGGVRIVRETADLDRCLDDGTLAAVLHLEGAEAIDPASRRSSSGTPPACAASARCGAAPTLRPRRAGRFPGVAGHRPRPDPRGQGARPRCNALGVLVDASHLNRAGFWDLAAAPRRRSSPRTPTPTRSPRVSATSPTSSSTRSAARAGWSASPSSARSCAPTAPTTATRRCS